MFRICLTLILCVLVVKSFGQTYSKVVYNQDTIYSISSKTLWNVKFKKPEFIPDGHWIVFESDTIPMYEFNTYMGAINGDFIGHENGVFSSEGKYHMDTVWTFRFSKFDDNRFKEGSWRYALHYFDSTGRVVGIEAIFNKIENLWYKNGGIKFESRGHEFDSSGETRFWFYPDGILRCEENSYVSYRITKTAQRSFDSLGNLIKITTVNDRLSEDTLISDNPRYFYLDDFNKKYNKSYLKKHYSDEIYYENNIKVAETIEKKGFITTIRYNSSGKAIKPVRHKIKLVS